MGPPSRRPLQALDSDAGFLGEGIARRLDRRLVVTVAKGHDLAKARRLALREDVVATLRACYGANVTLNVEGSAARTAGVDPELERSVLQTKGVRALQEAFPSAQLLHIEPPPSPESSE